MKVCRFCVRPHIQVAFFFLIILNFLPGCALDSSDHRAKPRYYVRNTPIPIPYPQEKPFIPSKTTSRTQEQTKEGVTTVGNGETLYGIARRTGVPVTTLIDLNQLSPPYSVFPGNTLRLGQPPIHQVVKGETLYSISRTYGVDIHTLASTNDLTSPYVLNVNQKLVLPVKEKKLETKINAHSNVALAADSHFLWPLKGVVLSKFGPKAGGFHNDGINIKGRLGEDVRAAGSGIVVYAGDGLKSYGNLILLRHDGGWVTAYAHNDHLLTARGSIVKQGDVIARVGQTGGVSEPQLHFELRHGISAVDPLPYLKKN